MDSLQDLLLANFVGLSADLRVSSGYDDGHPEASCDPTDPAINSLYRGEKDVWSVEDRRALADAMISRWQHYRAAIK